MIGGVVGMEDLRDDSHVGRSPADSWVGVD